MGIAETRSTIMGRNAEIGRHLLSQVEAPSLKIILVCIFGNRTPAKSLAKWGGLENKIHLKWPELCCLQLNHLKTSN
jgi:hypothetical protein